MMLRPLLAFAALTLVILAALPSSARAQACPPGCGTWFDGCNRCRCVNGRAVACTRKHCARPLAARCLTPPTVSAVPADPARSEACQSYARVAVQQYRALLAAGCRCWSARWHDNRDVHLRWCLSLGGSGNSERSETNFRIGGIVSCRSGTFRC